MLHHAHDLSAMRDVHNVHDMYDIHDNVMHDVRRYARCAQYEQHE